MMNPIAFVRKVDELGRIVIPIELRRSLGIAIRDALEIYVDGPCIMLKKNQPICVFCGNTENIQPYKGRAICGACKEDLLK